MPLLVTRDRLDSNHVTLSGIVTLCKDCVSYCLEKTERVMANKSRAPRGWEKEYLEIAEARRTEDSRLCVDACQLLPRSCPSVERLIAHEKYEDERAVYLQEKKKNPRTRMLPPVAPEELPSVYEMSRCENAAERFSKVLFAISHKPSKVHFDSVNPKTGEKMEDDTDVIDPALAAATAGASTAKKSTNTMDKNAINDEILKRWSTSRRERMNMEELGVIRTGEETQKLKEEMMKKKAQEEKDKLMGSGTLPKW